MWIVFYFMLVMRSREDLEEMRWEAMRYKNIFFSLSYFEQRRPWKREKTGGPKGSTSPRSSIRCVRASGFPGW
jgi:hypothetical protein